MKYTNTKRYLLKISIITYFSLGLLWKSFYNKPGEQIVSERPAD